MTRFSIGRLLTVLAFVCLALPGVASAASVSPQTVTGNPGCANINSTWSEFKIDKVPLRDQVYSGNGFSVRLSNTTDKSFDFSEASQGVDAVLVKAGTKTYIYRYSQEVTADSGLGAQNQQGISHVSFCFDDTDSPPPPNPCGTTDSDGDGMNDGCDNCPAASNPDQTDTDGDGMGDACEPTPPPPTCEEAHAGEADTDGDGKVDACDNCPAAANPGQEDSDNDGMGDACEPAQPTCDDLHAGETDTDGDGKVDACDNCPNAANMDQKDTDGDGLGDACEPAAPVNTDSGQQPQPEQQVAEQQAQAPAAETGDQFVLGERAASPTARLLAASGCAARTFSAGVRGTQISRVVFKLDGKRIGVVTKKNAKGIYGLRINPAKYRVGVHRLVVTVVFKAGSGAKPRTLRGSFQRCARQLVAPRFTG